MRPEDHVQKIVSHSDDLIIFASGPPENKSDSGHRGVLKAFEYRLNGDVAKLLRVQDFDFTWQIYDFDFGSRLMLVRSWDTMFPHGWLVNVDTGKRNRVSLQGEPLFLKTEVVHRFLSKLNNEVKTSPISVTGQLQK